MMADRWYSPKQDGSQEQHLCPLMPEGNRAVWRYSCHQGKRPVDRKPLTAVCPFWCSLLCIAKLFGNSVDGEDSPALGLNGASFQFLSRRMYFMDHMKALSKRYILWLMCGGRQMMWTWFCRAKLMTSRFQVCEQCPSSTEITGSSFCRLCMFDGIWGNHWGKISLCIHPEGWHAWIDQGGHQFGFRIFSWKYT